MSIQSEIDRLSTNVSNTLVAIEGKGVEVPDDASSDDMAALVEMIRVESYTTPELNSSYPQDVTVMESASASATFQVAIETDGKPAEYTYQWYVNGAAVSGATGVTYTKTGLTAAATYNVYCEVSNKAGTVTSRVATLEVTSSVPVYAYNGTHELIKDSAYNYRIKLKSSGTLVFSYLGCMENGIDVFCVGGGGGGTAGTNTNGAAGGGGGGYTTTSKNKAISANTSYTIVIGAGGSSGGGGGTTSAFDVTAKGGNNGGWDYHSTPGGTGGSGGGQGSADVDGISYGGAGGSDGSRGGVSSKATGAAGQGSTTREFAESNGTLYAGGGGGGCKNGSVGAGGAGGGGSGGRNGSAGNNGTTNTGGGGGGAGANSSVGQGGSGGSGIVVIRNKR